MTSRYDLLDVKRAHEALDEQTAERRAAWDAYIADMEISDVDGRPTADLRRQPAYRLPEVLR